MRIAICFFGQVKNFNDILYQSFIDNIISSINFQIDYFLATYNNTIYYNVSTNENNLINYESILKYFNFQQKLILDINADYSFNIDQFVKTKLKTLGYYKNWGIDNEQTTIRAIRQLYCLNTIYNSIFLNTTYDKYILCRPDCIFESKIDHNLLTNSYNINIPNFNHWHGYNDRFTIVDRIGLYTYCSRYSNLISNPQQYHSEKYLKYIIDQSKSTLYLFNNFRFRLLRANGQLSRPDY